MNELSINMPHKCSVVTKCSHDLGTLDSVFCNTEPIILILVSYSEAVAGRSLYYQHDGPNFTTGGKG